MTKTLEQKERMHTALRSDVLARIQREIAIQDVPYASSVGAIHQLTFVPDEYEALSSAINAYPSLLKENEELRKALEGMLDMFNGYSCPQLDAAITAMQRIGRDRWSMVYQMMKASVFEFDDGETNVKPDETLSKIENTTDGFIVSYWSGRFSKIFATLEEAVEAHKDNFCRD